MNAHVTVTLVEPYRFSLGQAVDHIGGGMPAIVLRRHRTWLGREMYDICVAGEHSHGRQDRVISGDALVAA